MGRINIEIPDDLHKEVKTDAVREGETLKDHVKSVLYLSLDNKEGVDDPKEESND